MLSRRGEFVKLDAVIFQVNVVVAVKLSLVQHPDQFQDTDSFKVSGGFGFWRDFEAVAQSSKSQAAQESSHEHIHDSKRPPTIRSPHDRFIYCRCSKIYTIVSTQRPNRYPLDATN
jgi:hypothetical protein